jgi:hypothetical protein
VTDYRSSGSVIRSCTKVATTHRIIPSITLDGLPILTTRHAPDLQDYRSACESPFPAYASAPVHAIRAGMRPDPTSVIGNPIMIRAGDPR